MTYIAVLITCLTSYWLGFFQQKYMDEELICDCTNYNLLEYIDKVNHDLAIDNINLKKDMLYMMTVYEYSNLGNHTYIFNQDTIYEEIYDEYDIFIDDFYNFKNVFVESYIKLLDTKRKLYNNCIKK